MEYTQPYVSKNMLLHYIMYLIYLQLHMNIKFQLKLFSFFNACGLAKMHELKAKKMALL